MLNKAWKRKSKFICKRKYYYSIQKMISSGEFKVKVQSGSFHFSFHS